MSDNLMKIRIVSPDRVFYEGKVKKVEFNTTEGEIGVLPGHIPLTVIIAPGQLTIHTEEGERKAALHSGFAEILPGRVTVLAELAEWPEEIDCERAEAAKKRAVERMNSTTTATQEIIDLARAEASLMRSLARLRAGGA